MSLLIVTGSHVPGPQGEFGVWGSEKVCFQVKHDPGSQGPVELCCHWDWTGANLLKESKTQGQWNLFGTTFVMCAPIFRNKSHFHVNLFKFKLIPLA